MDPELKWVAIYPELALAALIVVVLCLEVVCWPRRATNSVGYLTLCGSLAALTVSLMEWDQTLIIQAFYGMILLDAYTTFCDILVLACTIFTLLLSLHHSPGEKPDRGREYYLLLLLAALGMMFVVCAADLLVVFLGLELMSLALYALVGSAWRSTDSGKTGLKYFLVGVFASGFSLCGMALIYGAAGSTNLQTLGVYLLDSDLREHSLLFPGMALLLVGFGCKVAVVPFHMWTPDLHQKTPAPVTAFLSTAPKVAGFAVLARIFLYGFESLTDDWRPLLWGLAVLGMVGGNLLALNQRDPKRMLAYSSIAHTGYVLVGLVAANPEGVAGALFHLCAYTLTSMGSFAVLVVCQRKEGRTEIRDYSGLGFRHPLLGMALALLLLSLAGLPPTAGFVGRFYLFSAAVEAGFTGLAAIGVLSGAMSAYCCFKMVASMYMRRTDPEPPAVAMAPEALAVVLLAVLGTLGLGLAPGGLMEVVDAVAISLR